MKEESKKLRRADAKLRRNSGTAEGRICVMAVTSIGRDVGRREPCKSESVIVDACMIYSMLSNHCDCDE